MKPPILRIQKFSGTVQYNARKPQRRYYFRLIAANGKIVGQSEGYTTARARNKTVALLLAAKMEEGK